MPGWALPVVGGLVFAFLVGLWLTSALWFFHNSASRASEAVARSNKVVHVVQVGRRAWPSPRS